MRDLSSRSSPRESLSWRHRVQEIRLPSMPPLECQIPRLVIDHDNIQQFPQASIDPKLDRSDVHGRLPVRSICVPMRGDLPCCPKCSGVVEARRVPPADCARLPSHADGAPSGTSSSSSMRDCSASKAACLSRSDDSMLASAAGICARISSCRSMGNFSMTSSFTPTYLHRPIFASAHARCPPFWPRGS